MGTMLRFVTWREMSKTEEDPRKDYTGSSVRANPGYPILEMNNERAEPQKSGSSKS